MSPATWMALAAAGGVGAMCRYAVDTSVSRAHDSHRAARGAASRRRPAAPPLGTITVNLTACLLMGLLTGWSGAAGAPTWLHAVLGTGFLGGYSTFSTACLESVRLIIDRRFGAHLIHALAMTAGALAAAVAGLLLGSALG